MTVAHRYNRVLGGGLIKSGRSLSLISGSPHMYSMKT